MSVVTVEDTETGEKLFRKGNLEVTDCDFKFAIPV